MSMKRKLYIGFLIVIFLAMAIGALAILAFRVTTGNVRITNEQVNETVAQIVPVSAQFDRLSNSINEAGNGYYTYVFNYLDRDFQRGDQAMITVRDAMGKIGEILARAAPASMPTTRKSMVVITDQVKKLEETTVLLHDTVAKLLAQRGTMSATAEKASATIDHAFVEARERLGGIADVGADKDFGNDLLRRCSRLQVLNDLQDLLSNARIAFWQAQSLYGKASNDAYVRSIGFLEKAIKTIKEYNHPDNIRDPQTVASFNGMQAAISDYLAGMRNVKGMNEALDAIAVNTNATYRQIDSAVGAAATATGKAMDGTTRTIHQGMGNIASAVSSYTTGIIATVAVALALGLVIATLLVRNITLPVNRIIENLTASSAQINSAAGQISMASQSLAEGASTQAASLEETSSALEEMASMTRQNADNANKTNDTTRETEKLVEAGGRAIGDMSSAMAEIDEKAEKVGRIIKTIEDIAFQTNLLALNAAVEAARAGEAGKGFAVVADEVRNLSLRSAQAAKDTTELITSTVESVRRGSGIAVHLTESFSGIENGSKKVALLIENIATATGEQAQGVDQVNTAMAQMDKVTQRNAADAEETASSCEELNAQSEALVDAIGELAELVAGRASGYGWSAASAGGAVRRVVGVPEQLPRPVTPRLAKVDSSMVIPLDDGSVDDF